jgi:hypothetical protein
MLLICVLSAVMFALASKHDTLISFNYAKVKKCSQLIENQDIVKKPMYLWMVRNIARSNSRASSAGKGPFLGH